MIDDVEVGRRVAPPLRVAFEVDDAATATDALVRAGAELVAPPDPDSVGLARTAGSRHRYLQITLFEEQGCRPVGPAVVADGLALAEPDHSPGVAEE